MHKSRKIRAVVVEDESEGMKNMLIKLKKHCPIVEVVACSTTGEEAIRDILELKPHLVYLDISLGTMSGFDVLRSVQPLRFEIIFTTAYENFGIQAVKESAVDYLLKPIRPTELIEATDRARAKIFNAQDYTRILIPDGNQQLVFHVKDIIYCIADNNSTFIYRTGRPRFLAVKTLKAVEATLSSERFHRVSRSVLVNLDHVEAYSRSSGGQVTMRDGEDFKVSRNQLNDFIGKLGGIV